MGCCLSKKKNKNEPKPKTKTIIAKPKSSSKTAVGIPKAKIPVVTEEPKKPVETKSAVKQTETPKKPIVIVEETQIPSERSVYEQNMPSDKVAKAMVIFANETAKKGIEGLIKEFEKIEIPEPLPHKSFTKNAEKNRYTNIPCFDRNRVILKYQVPPESDYIHANRVETNITDLKNRFIVTQAPMENTVADFWRMVWQERPTYIVQLCKFEENGRPKCTSYWPETEGEQIQCGGLKVIHYGDVEKGSETAFEIKLIRVRNEKEAFLVKLCCFKDWPELGVPKTGMGPWRILRKIDMEKGTVIIHCSSGVGRAGILMAAEICMKALSSGNDVKMPEIIDELRTQRHGLVQSPGQYVYLHFAICTYLEKKLSTDPKAIKTVERLRQFFDDYKDFAANEEIEDKKRVQKKKRLRNETPREKK